MPRGIASQRIAKNRIAAKPIANRYGLASQQAPLLWVTAGSANFDAPVSGYWKFVGWGPGGGGSTGNGGGGSGAYVEITRYLAVGQRVALVVGTANSTDTSITFPAGNGAATAGRGALDGTGTGGVGGTATGGDVNINGSTGGATAGLATAGGGTAGGAAGSGNGGGAGAPGATGSPGGRGGDSTTAQTTDGYTPGGGAAAGGAGTPTGRGGGGMILAYLVRE